VICSSLLAGVLFAGYLAQGDAPAITPDLNVYKQASVSARRDPAAQVKLALWCEAHGLTAERIKHLNLAILLDPAHSAARGLLGLVCSDGKWRRPDDVSREAAGDPARQALLREYLDRRVRARENADAQWRLALWCEQNRLDSQAVAHLHRVVQLDPRREAAWKRLGYKKAAGQWIKPETLTAAKAELEAQVRANKFWKPRLAHLRDGLLGHDRGKRPAAERGLGQITDPRAVPMVWSSFARGSVASQRVATQIFGQIDAPGSSRALALLTVLSTSPEVRSSATEILRRRDPREYAALLVGMIRDRVKYKVSPVGGPGSPGTLIVEGRSADTERRYSPPSSPTYIPEFNDTVFSDAYGLPVVYHPLGHYTLASAWDAVGGLVARAETADRLQAFLSQAVPGPAVQQVGASISGSAHAAAAAASLQVRSLARNAGPTAAEPHGFETVQLGIPYAQIPIGQMIVAAQTTAWLAQKQLAADVQSVEELNAQIDQSNFAALQVLREVSGRDLGPDQQSWQKWLTDLNGYAWVSPPSPVDKPTIVQEVPLASAPQPAVTLNMLEGPIVNVPRHSCFGAGTLVHTWAGLRPIEELGAGDLVLTRDTTSGGLGFQPVVIAYHNPPNATYRIDLGSESIVATGIHRFWIAGQGWVMARDLKPGDRLRTVSGTLAIKDVQSGKVQDVFNLQLAGGDNFFVGSLGLMAHDNSIVNPVEPPFDRVPSAQDLVRK
jgi:hypothetical protein